MSVQLGHTTVLMSEHAAVTEGALFLKEVDSAILRLKGVPICDFCGFSELRLAVSVLTVFVVPASRGINPKLADLGFPISIPISNEVCGEVVVAGGGWVRLGAHILLRLSLSLPLLSLLCLILLILMGEIDLGGRRGSEDWSLGGQRHWHRGSESGSCDAGNKR